LTTSKDLSHILSSFLETEKQLQGEFAAIDEIVLLNQARVLAAFREHTVDETCFYDSTGYGYHDHGREKLDDVYASVFGTESGFVRSQFVSGTHAISCCIYGVLQRGDRLVSLTGKPYDTLQKALGLSEDTHGGLSRFGIQYAEADLTQGICEKELDRVLADGAGMVLIQRSRGYAQRRSLLVEDIEALVIAVKKRLPDVLVFVDNCYGEFAQNREPTHVGADIMAGSLIKNPGAGLAPGGGYVVGRGDLVEKAAWRLTAPGLGIGIGAMGGVKRLFYQGLFLAPHQVGQSLKGMTLAAALFDKLGYAVSPASGEKRADSVQAIQLDTPEQLKRFCRAVQAASPVDSHLVPQPAPMVGYTDEVIMAAGTFIQGASSEFSADAPLRPPYTVFLQGGLTYEHVKLALAEVLVRLELNP
jgi:cystathionine beta-lyase family protein involved in aluminum resistance